VDDARALFGADELGWGATMQRMKYACLAVALATTWLAPPAKAAEITTSENGSILITGRIQSGDETRVQTH